MFDAMNCLEETARPTRGTRKSTAMDDPSSEQRAKARAATQQARHLLLIVADLHKLGYECARVAPSIEDTPGGGDWYCLIVPASMISPSHGAIIDRHAAWRWGPPPGGDFPYYVGRGWQLQKFQSIFDSAENLLRAFPRLAEQSLGRDREYVAWYREMLRMTEPDGIIYARSWSDDEEIPQTGMRAFGTDAQLEVLVPLPPPGKARQG